MAKAKGTGAAGCCCGGCWAPPSDARSASTGDIIEVQHFCCRCVPKYLCVSLTSTGSYDSSSVLLSRYCGSVLPGETGQYAGDPIQFRGTIYWDNEAVEINIRLAVIYDQCYIFWEIPKKSESGYRPIDPNETASSYECGAGQRIEACKQFGGTWELNDRTLVVEPPQMLDISGHIKCAGCKCMCNCMCMSIYSRSSNGSFTLTGSNEIVCADIHEAAWFNCDESLSEVVKSAQWELDGWKVQLTGGDDGPPNIAVIREGTERTLLCPLDRVLRFADSQEHSIDANHGVAEVEYVFENTETDRTPLSFRWAGRSTGIDSEIVFLLYNWSTLQWESVGSVSGRPTGSIINRYFSSDIEARFIGSGANLNKVKLRLRMQYGEELHTDLLRQRTANCCKLKLAPKSGVTPASSLSALDMSQEGNCPTVFKFWNFFDQNNVEWFISIGCSWCGGQCGTVTTSCCPRPISRTLFAEVEITCPSCVSPFIVVLNDVGGNVWDGDGVHCGQPFSLTLACGSGGWSIVAEGAGACSYRGNAGSADCDPFNLVFQGQFGGGIGCCGVGSMTTTTPIKITVFE